MSVSIPLPDIKGDVRQDADTFEFGFKTPDETSEIALLLPAVQGARDGATGDGRDDAMDTLPDMHVNEVVTLGHTEVEWNLWPPRGAPCAGRRTRPAP